jgi:hypothetical protein
MIFTSVPEGVEIIPTGYDQQQPSRKPMHVEWYTELMGGLGDALLRAYSHEHCYQSLSRLTEHQKAAVVLMCHNPGLVELFKWHPMTLSGQLSVFDLGFRTPFHPWENPEWRLRNGLPLQSPCPMGGPVRPLEIFPSLLDSTVLQSIGKRYLLIHPSSGDGTRDVPAPVCRRIVEKCRASGFSVFEIGHSKYIHNQSEPLGAESLVDKLTVPGMMLAVRGAAGVITSHTSVTHVAWGEHRPVFLLYTQFVRDLYVSRGAVGHMAGIARLDNDHMLISEFSEERLEKWLAMLQLGGST